MGGNKAPSLCLTVYLTPLKQPQSRQAFKPGIYESVHMYVEYICTRVPCQSYIPFQRTIEIEIEAVIPSRSCCHCSCDRRLLREKSKADYSPEIVSPGCSLLGLPQSSKPHEFEPSPGIFESSFSHASLPQDSSIFSSLSFGTSLPYDGVCVVCE